jgi:spore coat polysaccharide biosynthesis protein SpsF (cytidylyltransferase family)
MESMIFAILQARPSSPRLSNKVLKSILGRPISLHQVESSQYLKKLID